MGRKNIIYNHKSIINGDMSLASITGDETNVAQHDSVTYHIRWTGGQATNGRVAIEATLDGIIWEELDFASTIDLDGDTDFHRAIVNEIGFKALRPVYIRTNALASGALEVAVFATNKGA